MATRFKIGDLVSYWASGPAAASIGIVLSVKKSKSHPCQDLVTVVWIRFDEDRILIGVTQKHYATYLVPYEIIHGS